MGGYILHLETDDILEQSRIEGRAEGRENGIKEERHNIIAEMLDRGKTPEEITEFCGYTRKQIKEVQDSTKVL